jgi:hypothetical protein
MAQRRVSVKGENSKCISKKWNVYDELRVANNWMTHFTKMKSLAEYIFFVVFDD